MSLSELLLYPFQKDLIAKDYYSKNALIINVCHHHSFQIFEKVQIVQNYKFVQDEWKNSGYEVLNTIPKNKKFEIALCHMPQSKEYCLYLMAEILESLKDDGLFICMAGNTENGKRLKKWLNEFGLSAFEESKQKHKIIWAIKKNYDGNIINQYLKEYGEQKIRINNKEFFTKPGIYGWNKIDKGSQLLLNNISDDLKGDGADFGSGYGFLSFSLEGQTNIKSVDLIDADYNALLCAKDNLTHCQFKTNFLHRNIISLDTNQKYDWIIMNPPFHQAKKTDHDIGLGFIQSAYKALKNNGKLYMVANNFLPYDKFLNNKFSKVKKITEEDGFKVLFAQK